ncbi:MAG: hypothetical protein FWH43_05805 [Endomicrobia bacterium]|nr:hypothetical protein [Endomicrobiia bacterium]
MSAKKTNLLFSDAKGSVIVMVVVFILIFSILALLTMKVAVLQNSNKLREYNQSRTFYAADCTVEQAAWLMSYITRGDVLTQNEFDGYTDFIYPPSSLPSLSSSGGSHIRQPARFPVEADTNEIIGVTGTQVQTIATRSKSGVSLGEGQKIFGEPDGSVVRRQIKYQMAPSFFNSSVNVHSWYPMVSTVSYRFDTEDTQLPVIMVRCHVEREDINPNPSGWNRPNPIDGWMTGINGPASGTNLFIASATFNNKTSVAFLGSDGSIYISWATGTGSIFHGGGGGQVANFREAIQLLFTTNKTVLVDRVRYYVIIAEAEAEDITSPNYPFRSVARFHFAVVEEREMDTSGLQALANDTAALLNPDDVKVFFEDVTGTIPMLSGYPANTIARVKSSIYAGKQLIEYSHPRISAVFRSRR